jgi:hypothetical protein
MADVTPPTDGRSPGGDRAALPAAPQPEGNGRLAAAQRVAKRREADANRQSLRRLRRSILVALLSGGSVSVLLVSALYTDVTSIPTNTFTIGTLDISSSPTSAAITATGMSPGTTTVSSLQVLNSGSLALRYAIRSTTTENTLAGQLDLTVKSGVSSCTTSGFGSSGTVIYGPGDLGNTTGLALVGSSTQGAQAGDRTLAASANETLCLQVSLPSYAGTTSQNSSTTATIDLIAEQTTNNP